MSASMSARAFISNGLRHLISNSRRHLRDCVCGPDSQSPGSIEDQSESGAALVEFTVLMPLFFLILFGIVEFGSMLWIQNNMTNAAREGARRSSVQGATLAQANTAACSWLMGSGKTFTVTATDKCPADQDVKVEVSVSKADASLMNTFFTIGSNGSLNASTWAGTLGASVTMRKEITCPAGASTTATCQCNTAVSPPTGC
jgi:Flp pilus assembly protein TadG